MDTGGGEPDEGLAGRIAAGVAGVAPRVVRRFTTGSQHYVFEALFDALPPLVVRIAGAAGGAAMRGTVALSRRLRPRGVPLPELKAAALDGAQPWIVLERLDGEDLGRVITRLPQAARAAIAVRIAAAQAIVAREASAGRYGYAVEAIAAPLAAWSAVLDANLARSRRRIAAAGLFDAAPVEAVQGLVERHRRALDALPAVPFLHDTTTKNVIVTADGRLSGIVDVDDLCFGDPRTAVALTEASLRVSRGPLDYTAVWLAEAGLADDTLFRLYVALFLVDFMAEHGQVLNGNPIPSTAETRQRLRAVFAESLARAG